MPFCAVYVSPVIGNVHGIILRQRWGIQALIVLLVELFCALWIVEFAVVYSSYPR
ncbi:MAG TPA: hypothetical protein VNN76_11670 [Bacteroidota bacterium]|nr:hypothetical protein [Bacteroidota bacterium]